MVLAFVSKFSMNSSLIKRFYLVVTSVLCYGSLCLIFHNLGLILTRFYLVVTSVLCYGSLCLIFHNLGLILTRFYLVVTFVVCFCSLCQIFHAPTYCVHPSSPHQVHALFPRCKSLVWYKVCIVGWDPWPKAGRSICSNSKDHEIFKRLWLLIFTLDILTVFYQYCFENILDYRLLRSHSFITA